MADKWKRLINIVKKDFFIILVCLMAVLACVYTIGTVSIYQAAVNRAWINQWYDSGCAQPFQAVNISFNYMGDYNGD